MLRPPADPIPLTRREFVTRLAICGCAIPALGFVGQTPRVRVRRIGLAVGDDPEAGAAAFRRSCGNLATLKVATS